MSSFKTEILDKNKKSNTLDKEVKSSKPKVGIYGLTSCYGCQLSIACVSRILDIVESVDIKCFYMLASESSMHEEVDIAFVEGSVSTEKDLEELKEIRENAKILVAVGACALHGGVQSWDKDNHNYDELYKKVYGDAKMNMQGIHAKPITEYVKVDYRLPGCPPEEDEIIYFVSTFLFGTWPEEKDYPVCQECRLAGNPCILIERGEPCLGPITTAGCKARCISFNVPCIGCRGPVPHETAWFDSLGKVFKEKGFTEEEVKQRMQIFGSFDPKIEERLKKAFGGNE